MSLHVQDPLVEPERDPAPREPSALDWLATLCTIIAGTMLVVLIAIFGWLVWGRYVMNDTPTWVEQVSLILVVWITFLGAAVGIHNGTHLSVDFLREGLTARWRGVARFLADAIVVAFAGVMAWQGWNLVEAGMGRAVPMLGISEAWRMVALPVSGALIVLFVAGRWWPVLVSRRRPGAGSA